MLGADRPSPPPAPAEVQPAEQHEQHRHLQEPQQEQQQQPLALPSPSPSPVPAPEECRHDSHHSPSADISALDGNTPPHLLPVSSLPSLSLSPCLVPLPPSPCSSAVVSMPVEPSADLQDGPILEAVPESLDSLTLPPQIISHPEMAPMPESQDPSASQVPKVTPTIPAPEPVSLTDIQRALRVQKYHQRRSRLAQQNLRRLQIAAARTIRLSSSARSVQHTLAECIRLEDKTSFANLLHSFHDACDACSFPDEAQSLDAEPASGKQPNFVDSFLDGLSAASQSVVLDLFSKLRYDGAFVADRLVSLTQKEMLGLLPDCSQSRSNESIFGATPRSTTRASRPMGFVVDWQIDLLTSQTFGSTLEALIHAPRTVVPADPVQNFLSVQVWAQVCARLITSQKTGSERMIPAVFDIFSGMYPWPGKERLEVWILQTIHKGSFILGQPAKQTFRARIEGTNDGAVEEEARLEAFFTQAVESLLELLSDASGASIIPPGALRLCRAISNFLSISPGHQRVFPQFVLTRWLFSSFLVDAIAAPEAHGLLTDHYLSEPARQKLLMEIARRSQRVVFDVSYSWKYGVSVPPALTERVYAVMDRLLVDETTTFDLQTVEPGVPVLPKAESLLAFSVFDALSMLKALFPQRRPASVSSDHVKSGLQSSASSISGFSLFGSTKVPDAPEATSFWHADLQVPAALDTSRTTLGQADNWDATDLLIRDACIELEELAVNRTPSGEHYWDALLVCPGSAELRTMRHSREEAIADAREDSSASDVLNSEKQSKISPQLAAARKAVNELMQRLAENENLTLPADPTSERSLLAEMQGLFRRLIKSEEEDSDFVASHTWHMRMRDLTVYTLQCKRPEAVSALLTEVSQKALKHTQYLQQMEASFEGWTRGLRPLTRLRADLISPVADTNERLRDKMWFVADVRPSAAYHELRSIAMALRTMGKPTSGTRVRADPPLRHWSTAKAPGVSLHAKSEAQILEILSARSDHGGPNKLSDEQSRVTEMWMHRQEIDNLCKGEERLHKLCMEVRKCVDLVTASHPAESPSPNVHSLFARDGSVPRPVKLSTTHALHTSQSQNLAGSARLLALHSNTRSMDTISSASHTLSSMSSRDYLDSRSPTLATRSSIFSIATTEARAASSATSVGSSQTQSAYASATNKRVGSAAQLHPNSLDRLRERVTSLLISDLNTMLFSEGSETDRAFWTGVGSDVVSKQLRSTALRRDVTRSQVRLGSATAFATSLPTFDFETAFARLLQRFSACANPSTKLACLYDIDRLLIPYLAQRDSQYSTTQDSTLNTADAKVQLQKNITEENVRGFRTIFSRSSLRPTTIFRDLQYIAALTPAPILQDTAPGKAFCNAAVAIMALKQEARKIMVETADSIIAHHSNNRGHHEQVSSAAQQQRDSATFSTPSRTSSAEDIARYTMEDAARLLQITAKEGDPVAQRELATLYLTHPELLDHIIAPFARPREVFKEELESKWRRNQDPTRCDPTTMCVAHHWMSLSSKGGDALAKEYLRQREEMDSF